MLSEKLKIVLLERVSKQRLIPTPDPNYKKDVLYYLRASLTCYLTTNAGSYIPRGMSIRVQVQKWDPKEVLHFHSCRIAQINIIYVIVSKNLLNLCQYYLIWGVYLVY